MRSYPHGLLNDDNLELGAELDVDGYSGSDDKIYVYSRTNFATYKELLK